MQKDIRTVPPFILMSLKGLRLPPKKRWKSEKLYKRKLSMRHSTLNKFTQNKHQLQVIAHILFLPKILKKID